MVDISQYWLSKLFYHVPASDQGISYKENLKYVLDLIASKIKAVLINVHCFERWLGFIR